MGKTTRTAALGLLALAFTAGQLSASESRSVLADLVHWSADSNNPPGRLQTAEISVILIVEIPAQRLRFRNPLTVVAGATVSQALETAYDVKHGLVCCDSRDIWAINGLAVDPYQEKWWVIKVNGNTQNVSSTTKIRDGDVVELVYIENEFYPTAHVRLEDWVAGAMREA